MNMLLTLYRLQTVDSQLDELQQKLATIAAQLADQSALQQAEKRFQELDAARQQQARATRKLEDELAGVRQKLASNQAQAYSGRIRDPKALQDLQEESAALQRRIAALEDQLLEAMLALEEAAAAAETAASQLKTVQAQAVQDRSRLQGEQTRLRQEVEQLKSQRDALHKQIPADVLALYDDLRRRKNGYAVSRIEEQSCSRCGATLTPALHQQVRQGQLIRCPSCSRLLYSG